ncbi:MAG: DUF4416 family protein [candidate division WOR-3 bacterium]
MNPKAVRPVKLIIGIIAQDDSKLLEAAEQMLGEAFAAIEAQSSTIPFDFTEYYEKEMGKGLIRRWVSCQGTVDPDCLVRTKLKSRELEAAMSNSKGRRRINLDPGILSLNNLILASTKDFAHRIYLGSGIYAEVTLIYRSGRFQPLEWTYPDYRTPTCLEFLAACRRNLLAALEQL